MKDRRPSKLLKKPAGKPSSSRRMSPAKLNTSSIAGHIGLAGAGVYVASKHAVNGLSKSAALEFAKKGIRVNTVSPGTIQTEMITRILGEGESDARKQWENQHPVGHFGKPDDVAAAVVW